MKEGWTGGVSVRGWDSHLRLEGVGDKGHEGGLDGRGVGQGVGLDGGLDAGLHHQAVDQLHGRQQVQPQQVGVQQRVQQLGRVAVVARLCNTGITASAHTQH